MVSTIEVSDIAAVHHLRIPIPEGGGLVVLRGSHGVGKSNTLKALDALASGRGANRLQVRDGAARGSIEGCGVKLVVGKSNRRSGELEVSSIEGRLSVSDLVDPGLVSEEAADAKRIKSLAQLAGVEADPAIFAELFGSPEEFERIAPPSELKTDDILVLTDRVKRLIESEARKTEGLANTERAKADACQAAADGVDFTVDADADVLSSRLESAIRRESELQTKRREALAHNKRIEEARTYLDAAKTTDAGQSLEACRMALDAAKQAEVSARARVESLRGELQQAEQHLVLKSQELRSADAALGSAERNAETVAAWEKTLAEAGAAVPMPTQDELDDASINVLSARKAVENGAVVRAARAKLLQRDEHKKAADAHEKRADSLRGAAANVDSVLSAQIAKLGCSLRVEKGRLVTDTDRGVELFAELSEGERWRIALDIAIDAVGPRGLLTIPQTAFEGLNKPSRDSIADHLRSRGATGITAEVTEDDELSAEVYQ